MSSMKPFLTFALIVAGAALPACAQRGGSHGGSIGHSGGVMGHSGGFTMHSAPASRPGFSSVGHMPFMGAPQLRYGTSHEVSAPAPFRGPIRGNRPPYQRRTDHPVVDRILRSYLPVYGSSLVYAYPNYLDPGDLNYSDYPSYDASAYSGPAAGFVRPLRPQ